MTAIVVDKSFLQGSPASEVRSLAVEHRLLVSDALFYELLTTEPRERCQCFAKFPEGPNPVDLVSHIGTLMRIEIETHKPSGPPSSNKENIDFTFSARLTEQDYVPPPDAQLTIDEETARLESSVRAFIERTKQVRTLFPNLLEGDDAERTNAHLDAEHAIATPGALLPFLAQLEPPPGEKPLPPIDLISHDWAIYRWLQVQLLFAVDLYVRYQDRVDAHLTPKVLERIEHDVLDAELLMLGCLENAFATQEKKHKRWWNFLSPGGALYERD